MTCGKMDKICKRKTVLHHSLMKIVIRKTGADEKSTNVQGNKIVLDNGPKTFTKLNLVEFC